MKNRIERVKMRLADIKLDDTNPNQMNDRKEKALDESFNRFGYVQEIVIDKKTSIMADGEHRLKKLLAKGEEFAEVKVIDFKNESERKIFRQMMNKIHGEHDTQKDAKDIQILMQDYNIEEISLLLGDSEQELIKTLSISSTEGLEQKEVEKVNRLYNHHVTCPKCGHEFEKAQQ